ncbi:hypothetical protein OG689_44385 [Kitasatospora sp. NBC_00240]|uniref:hypothetical protein n=1 Tax=Kitasatospora sp. NBC_00240 TaxID=2903567 RepID=UPI0022586FBF|nr:hypothetical protein [Kitasatospora sp. NBC_00240]MCX5216177.1 hypothetical protein [Kitasatospora sp. NBC_00240]
MSESQPAPSSDITDAVSFIIETVATLLAQRWGVRLGKVLRALSSPDALDVTTARYLLALGSGLSPAAAASAVGRALMSEADAHPERIA